MIVYNAQGQVMNEIEINSNSGSWKYTIDISDYAPGVYAVSYTNESENKMKRFVVE